MKTAQAVLAKLHKLSRPDQLAGMQRFGMTIDRRLGISIPQLRKLANQIGQHHDLAIELWKSGMAEAMILAALIDVPEEVTSEQMDSWVADFNSWDVCDQVCMNLFDKTPLAWKKVFDWSEREEEYVKRAAFALIACLAWHDKTADDEQLLQYLPLIQQAADDERNYVKKAVSWALRHIGKRNASLHPHALQTANQLKQSENKTARWIGSDAIRDLNTEATLRRIRQLSK
jgi:3-methyladenine DNA glycosylase AlkD